MFRDDVSVVIVRVGNTLGYLQFVLSHFGRDLTEMVDFWALGIF